MSSFLKFGDIILFLILVLTISNEVVIDQLILFYKPKKNEKWEDDELSHSSNQTPVTPQTVALLDFGLNQLDHCSHSFLCNSMVFSLCFNEIFS